MNNAVAGFSKLSKQEKINWIAEQYFSTPNEAETLLKKYWNTDEKIQQLHDEFIENTISNFYLPLGIAPNFLINGKYKTIPMVIEESSVVAAASKAAKFWATRGGFKTTILGTEKIGQVHFIFDGELALLEAFFEKIKPALFEATESITQNMRQRGGGITDIVLKNKTSELKNYYQLHATFETKNSMGANFINSCLEQFAVTFKEKAAEYEPFQKKGTILEIIMSILSNYVPNCVVRAEVSCPVSDLAEKHIPEPLLFAQRFVQAVQIAEIEPFRAVTHNKGIMNGVDAVVLATGNDFRAIEAAVHAYAAKNGTYSSLSHAKIENGVFTFWVDLPLALGTVGGLTTLHPMVKFCLTLLENPSATELMEVIAVAGLAQNFAALRSLTTTGIQAGHMKMHLNNILNQLEATEEERQLVQKHFKKHTVSHSAVVNYITAIRN
ncbi:hydroxymethylglutaryl-CoA reductase, degradative [Flavobacterium agrisoli]|uniref:3-hydroxy-3-methylglutaryl coenzyme A reductase n=1 Tax=Flavobacterium agrisoli TaxID=2793066 RepID=A0A934UK81_9FLAO|nr:hydroxymethylglutaryl-CoA reductase, degradative [Flavobacterium agrisoli]MBK0370682.1 hydroxymethylglutaryl-CoA reductase, degradative [Flavobacterium agrisoli]